MAVTEDYKPTSDQLEHQVASQTSSENGVANTSDLEKRGTEYQTGRVEGDPDRVTAKTWLVVFVGTPQHKSF